MSLVIFAGAGCSIGSPASVPGWFDLNDAILEALWDRMTPYNLPNGVSDHLLNHIKEKRKEYAFPSDYQAQVMVERVGMKYFELLTVVDSDLYNALKMASLRSNHPGTEAGDPMEQPAPAKI